MSRAAAAALAAVLLAAPVPAARAEEDVATLPVPREGVPHTAWRNVEIRARWGPSGGDTGWGWVRVDLRNEDDRARTVRLATRDHEGRRLARREVRLDGSARATTFLPRLPGCEGVEARVGTREVELSASDDAAPLRVVMLGFGPESQTDLERKVEAVASAALLRAASSTSGPRYGGGRSGAPTSCAFTRVGAGDLPPSWTHLTSVSLVVVSGDGPGLDDAARQTMLRRYAETGGTLLVLEAGALPRGPLADLVAGVPDAEDDVLRLGRAGLGRWATVSESILRTSVAERLGWPVLGEVTQPVPWEPGQVAELATSLPRSYAVPEEIPGLGRVDARGHFLAILLFAVLVGPVAYLVLKRRRRLVAMVFVVPAAGLLFTSAILLYGLFSEGLGTRGVVSTVSVLDQRVHEASCVASRTLYSGWSRDPLRLSPDTALHAPATNPERQWHPFGTPRDTVPLHLDADASVVSAAVLPSRTVTVLATVGRAPARERLRFRRAGSVLTVEGGEGFQVASPPELAPAIVLRDADGRWYVGEIPGTLRAAGDAEGADALARLRRAAGEPDFQEEEDDPSGYSYTISGYGSPRSRPKDRSGFLDRLSLGPSSYAAFTTRAPGFDDLGLDVDWSARLHLTLGLLAPEDLE